MGGGAQTKYLLLDIAYLTVASVGFLVASVHEYKKHGTRSAIAASIGLFFSFSAIVWEANKWHLHLAAELLHTGEKLCNWVVLPLAGVSFLWSVLLLPGEWERAKKVPQPGEGSSDSWHLVPLIFLILLSIISVFMGAARLTLFLLGCTLLYVCVALLVRVKGISLKK